MSKAFASKADMTAKVITFTKLSENAYAYTAEGDPNSGVIIGDDCCMVIDTTATPAMARDLITRIREVTDKPIKYIVLSHYHAVRVLGASEYFKEGGQAVIASRETYELIVERGEADMKSEIERFAAVPGRRIDSRAYLAADRLRQATDAAPGQARGRAGPARPGHTRGDTIAWIPSQKICFSGDLVEYNAGVYTGDAQLEEWPATLDKLAALKPEKLVPGRGPALETPEDCAKAIAYTRKWVTDLFQTAKAGVAAGKDLKAVFQDTRKVMDPVFGNVFIYEHCLPFDVSRAYDEAQGIKNPRVWTAQRDQEMWQSLQD